MEFVSYFTHKFIIIDVWKHLKKSFFRQKIIFMNKNYKLNTDEFI